MIRWIVHVSVMLAVAVGFSSVVHADDYGPLADAYKCAKEIDAVGNESTEHWSTAARKSGKGFSAECKAEIEKRVPVCEKDPWMQRELTDPELNRGDPKGLCFDKVFSKIGEQIDNDRLQKKHAEEVAKAKQEEKAKAAAEVAAVELPKAKMHDPQLEQAVASAYTKAYPGNKVLQVVLGRWSDDYEKDAFGRVTGRDLYATVVNRHANGKCELHGELWLQHGKGKSFSGPLSARGGGSAETNEILCSKVNGGAKKSLH